MCKSDPAPAAADDESWLVYIDGQGVDVSAFSKRHPGGTKALRIYKNRDATEIFRQYHSDQAKDRLGAMVRAQQSGPTAPARSPRTAAMEDDLQALEDSARAAGAFRTSFTHEASKAFVVLGPIALGVYLMRTGTVAEAWCGVALLVFGQYQNGWVSHDWAHHGILESPWGNDIVATIGAAIQGYDLWWWKARHNTHHICTNEIGNDPDVLTSPLLTYVSNSLDPEKVVGGLGAFQKHQSTYFLPAMAILDLFWRYESIVVVLRRFHKKGAAVHAALLVAHYVGTTWAFARFASPWTAFLVFTLAKGFLTGTTVFTSHYAEPHLSGDSAMEMSLLEQTVSTSRNVSGGWWLNFYTGFISLQIEHHLFPRMPTSGLASIQPAVQLLCRKHALEYREDTLFECLRKNMRALRVE